VPLSCWSQMFNTLHCRQFFFCVIHIKHVLNCCIIGLGLSKYDYNTILVVIYCNNIVLSNPAIICIGSVFIVYHMQFVLIINHINQTIL
jgi:hypothetical protein